MSKLLGILNRSPDSFSDGGKHSSLGDALEHAEALLRDGADAIDIGAVSSNPDSTGLPPADEIAQLAPVVEALHGDGHAVSLDTFSVEVQRWGLAQDVAMLNDIRGFPEPSLWPELASASTQLVVMHALQDGPADRRASDPATILDRVLRFFDDRIEGLVAAGVSLDRILVDPGMGFFLGDTPEPSLVVLRSLETLRERTGCPVLVSVSRKSFLGAILGGRIPSERRNATLAAELYAALHGADWIRTHEPRPLRDALAVWSAVSG